MTKTINITKEGGAVLYRDYIHETIDNALKTCPNGKYTLSIKKDVKKRTLDQSRWFWLCMVCIEKETGTDRNDAHDFFCTKFLRRKALISGIEVDVIYGTSKLNTIQFRDFMENIQAFTSQELGITLPNPDDLMWEQFKNEYERFI